MDIYQIANQMKAERKTIFDMKMRVTFYARVSTTREEQENSIENQIAFFTDMIQKNENWEYIEGYVDRIRGEAAENRVNFMRMIEDGKAGLFDLVLTKEVSRFARNTIDSRRTRCANSLSVCAGGISVRSRAAMSWATAAFSAMTKRTAS